MQQYDRDGYDYDGIDNVLMLKHAAADYCCDNCASPTTRMLIDNDSSIVID